MRYPGGLRKFDGGIPHLHGFCCPFPRNNIGHSFLRVCEENDQEMSNERAKCAASFECYSGSVVSVQRKFLEPFWENRRTPTDNHPNVALCSLMEAGNL